MPRFLIPKSFNVHELTTIVRKKLHMAREEAVFLLIDGRFLMKHDSMVLDAYAKHADQDGFLYI